MDSMHTKYKLVELSQDSETIRIRAGDSYVVGEIYTRKGLSV